MVIYSNDAEMSEADYESCSSPVPPPSHSKVEDYPEDIVGTLFDNLIKIRSIISGPRPFYAQAILYSH